MKNETIPFWCKNSQVKSRFVCKYFFSIFCRNMLFYYFRRRLAREGIVTLGVTLSRLCVCPLRQR